MRTCAVLTFALCLGVAAAVGPPPNNAEAARIAALIKQLGDDSYARRQDASKKLEAIGDVALPALRTAALTNEDAEVRRRAEELLASIQPGTIKSKTTGLKLVRLVAGELQMGSPKGETGRRPDEGQHRVRITKPFYLGVYEVTQGEYQKVMKANPSWFTKTGPGQARLGGLATGQFPVERVTWYDAVEFCNRLSKLDGLKPYYTVGNVKHEGGAITAATVTVAGGTGYRLPSEAEWEYACRAGTSTPFHFGKENTGREANVKPIQIASGYGSSPKWRDLMRTEKVGSYAPNKWGLYDMHGNVNEWCQDWYDKDYYDKSPRDDPKGPVKGDHRVLRGGSWLVTETSCRAASRFSHAPGDNKYYAGFRVARSP